MENKKIINKSFINLFDLILREEYKNLKSMGLKELTINELHLLVKIKELQDKRLEVQPKILLNELGITKGTLSTATTKLINKNYIEKTKDDHDGRKIYFTLKPKSDYAIKLHQKWHEDLVEVGLEGFTEEEIQKVEVLLNNIEKNIKKRL